jgi:predicted short-subunit dehydrogenase-like oxidoreductase (DUF2520 family)
MKSNVKPKIVIIGCGNLAWHLVKHLFSLKTFDLFVYNHQPNALLNKFKMKLNCFTGDSLSKIVSDADYYFVCVADKFVSSVSRHLKNISSSSVVVLTSGSVSLDDLHKNSINKGVFYPVQTFSVADDINWAEVPVIIEGNNVYSVKKVKEMGKLFSKKILQLKSAERLKLHLSAVLVNNFTNSLYVAADNFISNEIKNKEVNFKLLLPLIQQTTLKINKMSPVKAQTGPAKRKDGKVIKKHLRIIKNKDLKKTYRRLTELILAQQNISSSGSKQKK